MRKGPRHPGGTGIYHPKDPRFSTRQRDNVLRLARGWELEQLDEDAFWKGVCDAAAIYNAARDVGDASSAGSIRNNLRKAVPLARKLRDHLGTLDGNSMHHANLRSPSRNVMADADGLLAGLEKALGDVLDLYPKRGRRPPHEQLKLVIDLADLMRNCSSMSPRPGDGNFDSLVEVVFELVGLQRADVHRWIDKALSRDWEFEFAHGVLVFDPEAKSPRK